jgi:hypothetical protein
MMARALLIFLSLLAALSALMAPSSNVAHAAFHCMRIHAVMAGFSGNANIQYVELRMNTGGQAFLAGHTIEFFDSAGTLKATFTFPAGVSNAVTGDSVLIGTSEFNGVTTGGDADFTFTSGMGGNTVGANGGDPLHPIQGANGRVHFGRTFDNCDPDGVAGPGEVDSVGYGTGTAHFGSSASALPSPPTNQALILNNLSFTPSNNSTEYALGAVSGSTFSVAPASLPTNFATPRNNARTVLAMISPPAPVGGVGELPAVEQETIIQTDDGERNRAVYGWLLAATAAGALVVAGTLYRRRMRQR